MKKILKKLAYVMGSLLALGLKKSAAIRLFNYVFERSPHFLVNFFVKFVPIQINDYYWHILLLNKKTVKTKIETNNLKTQQFAFSYKWHSQSLNKLEYILNNHYSKDIPWIDVGANLGLRSLLALSEGRPVFFLEPNKQLNKLNIERCKLNSFNNYTLLEYGASNKKGEVEFVIDRTSYNSSIEKNTVSKENIDRTEIIKIDTIDNLLADEILECETACIKIDVEGHELKVLEGAANTIKKFKPTLIIEVSNHRAPHFTTFCSFMSSHQYSIYEIYSFNKRKILRELPDNYKPDNIRSNDFLCVSNQSLIKEIQKYLVHK